MKMNELGLRQGHTSLTSSWIRYCICCFVELIQNATIEERVVLLEIRVEQMEEDISCLDVDLTEVDKNVDFLFDEQVIQDERLLNLEQTSLQILGELDLTEDELEGNSYFYFILCVWRYIQLWIFPVPCPCLRKLITDLQDTTLTRDFRETVLENGGDNGNSSVAELEVRVETLEGTAADHETRIAATELDINGKDKTDL